jgi:hypothetical protein
MRVLVAQWLDYLTTHTSLSPIWCGFVPDLVNYKKGCTWLTAASDKVYQLLAHGRWFSPGTLASSTTKTPTGRHDIAEILLKVALNTKNHIRSELVNRNLLNWWLKMFPCRSELVIWIISYRISVIEGQQFERECDSVT